MSRIEEAFKSSSKEADSQEVIGALNHRIEQLLNELVAVRIELYDVQSSQQRLKSSVTKLKGIIITNENDIRLLRARNKAGNRATLLLNQRLSEAKEIVSSSTHEVRLLKQENEYLVRLNTKTEEKCRRFKEEYAILEQAIAEKVRGEKACKPLTAKKMRQNTDGRQHKSSCKRGLDKGTQCDDIEAPIIRVVDDCVSTAAFLPEASKIYRLEALRKKADAQNSIVPVNFSGLKDKKSTRVSKVGKSPRCRGKHHRAARAPSIARDLERFFVQSQMIQLNRPSGNVLEYKDTCIPTYQIKHRKPENVQTSITNSMKQNEEKDMEYLLALPELPPSPPLSTSSLEDPKAAKLQSEESLETEEAMVVEPSPAEFQCIPRSWNAVQEISFNGHNQEHPIQMNEDVSFVGSSMLITGIDDISEVPFLVDTDMHETNHADDVQMKQDEDYDTGPSLERMPSAPNFQVSTQSTPQNVIIWDYAEGNHFVHNNVSNAQNTSILDASGPTAAAAAIASFSRRDHFEDISSSKHMPLQLAYETCKSLSAPKLPFDEITSMTTDEELPIFRSDDKFANDETDSLDYLFEGGPEELRDLFPEGLDDDIDIFDQPSETQIADVTAIPSPIDVQRRDKTERDEALSNEESETSVSSRRYRRTKRNPLACLRPNVPGWSISRKNVGLPEGNTAINGARLTSEASTLGGRNGQNNPEAAINAGKSVKRLNEGVQSEKTAIALDTPRSSPNRREPLSAVDTSDEASQIVSKDAKIVTDDDIQDRGSENQVIRERLLAGFNSKGDRVVHDPIDPTAAKAEDAGRQLESLKRRRPINEVIENSRTKKPETDSERYKNSCGVTNMLRS